MTFQFWIEYPQMSIAVSTEESTYICTKYVGGSKIQDATMRFSNIEELESFLLSLAGADQTDIRTKLETL